MIERARARLQVVDIKRVLIQNFLTNLSMQNQKRKMKKSIFFCFVVIFLSSSSCSAILSKSMASVHIVYTERPTDEEPETFHIRTLVSVLGSEEAAREALVYSYKTAASGFSAKLTSDQVSDISKQPGVLQVVPSRTLQLHSGTAGLH